MKLTEAQKKKISETKRSVESINSRRKIEREKRKLEFNDLEPLKCSICGYISMFSLTSHIPAKHKMKMQEYRETYPNDIIQRNSPSQNKILSTLGKQKLLDDEERKKFLEWRSFPSEIKHWTRKGFSEEEARQKVFEFQSEQALKGNNEKTRALRSKKYSGDNNPMSLKSIADRNSTTISEARKMTPCYGRTGESHPMFGKKHTEESIRKIASNINTTHKSKLEREITDIIVEKYGGLKNEYIDGWCCDYVNHERKIIVEIFGDFWHHNPEKYSDNWVNPFTKRSTEYVRERDGRKLNEIKNLGYEVIVIWEADWHSNNEKQLKRVDDAFDSI